MSYKLTDIITGLLFAGLLIGTGFNFIQLPLKNESQVSMLLFGVLTFASLLAKPPFRTSIPFFILLGIMLYINIFLLTNLIINTVSPISPDDGWFVDPNGERHPVMQMNWIWGILAGLVLSPPAVILYHKKVKRNKGLEISLTAIFVILAALIYMKHRTL